jgi:hypothetical protein
VHTALVDIFGEKGKNIVTHHAEDGSGVGSAIIAGESTVGKVWVELTGSNDQGSKRCWILCRLLDIAVVIFKSIVRNENAMYNVRDYPGNQVVT